MPAFVPSQIDLGGLYHHFFTFSYFFSFLQAKTDYLYGARNQQESVISKRTEWNGRVVNHMLVRIRRQVPLLIFFHSLWFVQITV